MSALTESPTWQQLVSLAETVKGQHMRDWFLADPERASSYSLSACGIELDYSKNLISGDVMQALQNLAKECLVTEKRDAMFAGEIINHTEQRAVLHTALRGQGDGAAAHPVLRGHRGEDEGHDASRPG